MNTKPKVSIGMPVYNGDEYIAEAIDSILGQTFQDFELIISDNASTDRTQEICLEYVQKDARISYHRNEKNLGAAPNYNLVFNLAKGEYFKWAAADDKLAPEFISKCVEALDRNPDVVLCVPRTRLIDPHGEFLRDFDYKKADADFSDPKKRFRNFLLFNMSGNFIFGLLRTSAIAKTSLHGSYTSSDLVLLSELTLYGRFLVVPDYLFLRRDHPGQSTKGVWKSERARPPWFNSSLEGKIVLPKWIFLFSCLRAVNRAPLTAMDRISCYLTVGHWILLKRNFWGFGKDVAIAVQKFFMRSFSKRPQRPAENQIA